MLVYYAKDGELRQIQPFFITDTQFAIQAQVKHQPNSMERLQVFATLMPSRRTNYYRFSYIVNVGTLSEQWPGIGDACQNGNMATCISYYAIMCFISFCLLVNAML